MAKSASSAGLTAILEIELDRFAIDDPLVRSNPDAFLLRRRPPDGAPVDPRKPGPAFGEARARLRSDEATPVLLPALRDRLERLADAGFAGFRIRRPDAASPALLGALIAALKAKFPEQRFILNSAGVPRERMLGFAGTGVDRVTSSVGYWDMRAPWLAEEHEALRTIAPLQAEIMPDALRKCHGRLECERLMRVAAATATDLVLPADVLRGPAADALGDLFALSAEADRYGGEMRQIPLAGVTALVRGDAPDMRTASRALLLLINGSLDRAALPHKPDILNAAGADFAPFEPLAGDGPAFGPLAPGEVRALSAKRAEQIALDRVGGADAAEAAAARPRLTIENVLPAVEGGQLPVKRIVGEVVTVAADFYGDGHEQLAAELRWRGRDEEDWQRARMEQDGNDRWHASFPLERLGRHEYVVEGWLDRYGGFRRDFRKKLDAGVDQEVDRLEGRQLIEEARKREKSDIGLRLEAFLKKFDAARDPKAAAEILLDPELALVMDEVDRRPFAVSSEPHLVDAERLAARFSSWYELFPRSQTDDPARHGTFADVIERLPAIREMGFDTLYFPPIHPIGRTHRKGPNNTLDAGAEDPGSPYAIGSDAGGHDAVHPELGTLEDFRALISAAREQGLEIALDFAIQCSPDHPWLKEHPGWFDWRPDGTIKYAENPPKKYQDIVNVDFWKKEAIPGLWIELRDVILFWIDQGVLTFRVDNPHTKPFPFWEWMIREVRSVHPEAIFLAEAFTRPKVMYRLAKIGFSQSYTYFTWRNEKGEIADYVKELTTTAPKDFFRPHFFVNTPDINPTFLQTSGRAGFRIRAVLAGTLSGLFGVYSGFELCEARPVPGKEEYWESEKYEVKPRDWQAPGNIIADITLINRLRRAYPALQTHLNTVFFNAWNNNILYYGKPSPDGAEMILVAVSLDPHNAQEADFEVPLWEWGIEDHGSIEVEDLVGGRRFQWHGKTQHVRLDPDQPYAIWRIAPPGGAT